MCIFADVIYMNMRIEINSSVKVCLNTFDVIYMNMRIEIFSMEELREMEADNWTPSKKGFRIFTKIRICVLL